MINNKYRCSALSGEGQCKHFLGHKGSHEWDMCLDWPCPDSRYPIEEATFKITVLQGSCVLTTTDLDNMNRMPVGAKLLGSNFDVRRVS